VKPAFSAPKNHIFVESLHCLGVFLFANDPSITRSGIPPPPQAHGVLPHALPSVVSRARARGARSKLVSRNCRPRSGQVSSIV
jgi:hypothetical protein